MPDRIRRAFRQLAPRRSLATLAACSAVLLAGQMLIVSVPQSIGSASSCSQLKRWAEGYRNTSPTLERVASLDRRHRIALLNVLAPETQAALWREHLKQFGTRPDLSTEQRAFITEGVSLTTAALYRHDAAATRAMNDLEQRAKPFFATRAQALPWYDLGALTPPTPVQASLWSQLSAPFRAEAQTQWCECTVSANEVFCPGACMYSACQSSGGCGWDGHSICDGMCM